MSNGDGSGFGFGFGSAMGIFAVLVGGVGLWGCPQYNVYASRLGGQAEYEKAEQNRRVRVLEAQALMDSAKLTAGAEIERSKGVAEANKIIAESLGGAEGYLRWRYIEMLEQKGGHDVIYLPTEAGLPILEAGRITRPVVIPPSEEKK